MLVIVKDLFLRAGKEEHRKYNNSYGVATLDKKHILI